jgi:adenosine deaminase
MKNILLITLGKSTMIIPEAVLSYGVTFDEVHVFTTDNEEVLENAIELQEIFINNFPSIRFSITSLRGISMPNTTETQELFEEALFQWYLEKAGENTPYACITGGIKTIPATMQQAARYFGALDIFHLLTDLPQRDNPTNYEAAKQIVIEGKVKLISLGNELGWESLKNCTSFQDFSSTSIDSEINCLCWKDISENKPLRKNIRHIMQAVKSAAIGNEDVIVPFSLLRLLPPEAYFWLQQPLNGDTDKDWINSLPKTELHCHLGGFATHPPLLDEVILCAENNQHLKIKEVPKRPYGWPLPEDVISLPDYMHLGDANGSALLKDVGCLKKQIALIYAHFLEQNIRYAEVRCSPDNYSSSNSTPWDVLQTIQTTFQSLMDEAFESNPDKACHVNLLIIANRRTEGDLSSISRHLALAITSAQFEREKNTQCQVVGVDLAGYENKNTRPAYFANDFIGVHRSGLAVTAHAGENDDAESIWQAVHQLHARRIGHALELYEAKDLKRTMAERKIGIEMCPYANFQIKGYYPMRDKLKEYPLLDYLKSGLLVTVNTDNIGISEANLTDNFLLLAKLCPKITRLEILLLIRNGLEVSFINPQKRQQLITQFDRQVFNSCKKNNSI